MDCSAGDDDGMTTASDCAVLIPAFEEATTVGTVVSTAVAAQVGPVVVVDDGSTDGTAEVARSAGAEVLRLPTNLGKGGALEAGARSRPERVLVLLDADLVGLTPEHVRDLADPVNQGQVEMSRGVFSGGRLLTTAAQVLWPRLNGQRGLLREGLLQVRGLAQSRYGVEVAISDHAKRHRWRIVDVPLTGVSQVMKEEKRGWWRGLLTRIRMYFEIARQDLRQRIQRLRRKGR